MFEAKDFTGPLSDRLGRKYPIGVSVNPHTFFCNGIENSSFDQYESTVGDDMTTYYFFPFKFQDHSFVFTNIVSAESFFMATPDNAYIFGADTESSRRILIQLKLTYG